MFLYLLLNTAIETSYAPCFSHYHKLNVSIYVEVK
jgi:hypothetical protein